MLSDIKPIRVFLAVAKASSFSQAARELGLAPASVTRIVAQLEADLGTQLLVRTTRQVALTSAGAMVVSRYSPLVNGFDEVTRELLRAARPDVGRLRLTAPVSLGVQLLPRIIAGFRAEYPEIQVDLNFTDTLLDVIEDNCDLAVRVSGPPSDKSTIWQKLCGVPCRAIAAPSLFDGGTLPQHPDDLRAYTCMSYSHSASAETWEFSQSGTVKTLRASTEITSNNGDFLYALAVRGEGVCVLPDFITSAGRQAGDVVQVCPDWSLPSLWLTLFYPPYEKLPPLVGTFAEYFERFVTAHPELVESRHTAT